MTVSRLQKPMLSEQFAKINDLGLIEKNYLPPIDPDDLK